MACCCPNPSVSSADDSFSVEFLTDTDPPERAVAHATNDPDVQAEQYVESDVEGSLKEAENNAIAHNAIAQDQQAKAKEKSQRPKICATTVRLYHCAVNRIREMVRIDRENRTLLRRLNNMKPSARMSRSEQLAEYDRQERYRAA